MPAFAGTHAEPLYLYTSKYMIILFFEGARIWSGVFFVSASVWDYRNWNFSVKLIRSSAVFEGRLQRSPCLVRSEPRRERRWGLGKTSEKLRKCCILGMHSRAFGWILTSAEFIYGDSFYERTDIWSGVFSSRPQYRILETEISRSNRLVRAPSSRGGSNAPHPALSVPHHDVNADEG